MKLKTLKPLYLGGQTLVEGTSFETIEQHGRELVHKGYAEPDSTEGDSAVVLSEDDAVGAGVLTSDSVATPPKTEKLKTPAKGK